MFRITRLVFKVILCFVVLIFVFIEHHIWNPLFNSLIYIKKKVTRHKHFSKDFEKLLKPEYSSSDS